MSGPGMQAAPTYKLYAHQAEAVAKAMRHNSYAVFAETGTGKSIIGIELIHQFLGRDCSGTRNTAWRALVVCPLSCIESVWLSELTRWAPHLKTLNLWEHRKTKPEKLPLADVYVVNYESAQTIDTRFLVGFDFVLLDESTKIKNPKAQVTKFFLAMRKYWRHRLAMSGLPAPNNLAEYWSQMCFINPTILGDNFYRFRATNFYNMPRLPYLWAPTKEFKERLPALLAQQAYVVKKADCLDLPPKTYVIRSCQLSPAQRKCYDQMVKLNITTLKDKPVLAANELAKIMKLRQITSGFAVDAEGNIQEWADDSKLKLLMEVLDEIGERQVIIWIQFHAEIERIKEALGRAQEVFSRSGQAAGDEGVSPRFKFGVLAGTESQKEKEQAIEDFKAGKIQYLIAHPRTAGHGLTLTSAAYAVYYSLSYSLEEYAQSQDRIHRIGQTESCTYIHLAADKTIDQVIYRALQGKISLSNAVLEMVKELS